MASKIKQRGDKKIWWYYGNFNNQQYRESLKTTDKGDAKHAQAQLDAKYNVPDVVIVKKKKNPLWAEFWPTYEAWGKLHREPKTLAIQKAHWDKLEKFAKPLRLGDVRRETVEAFKKHRRGEVGEQSVDNNLKDIQTLYNWAIDHGHYSGTNPAKGVVRFRPKPPAPDSWSREEIDRLLEKSSGKLKMLILLCTFCGLRKKEATNITWEQFNFTEKVIHIRENPRFKIKTDEWRFVPMPDRVVEAFQPLAGTGFVFESTYNSGKKYEYVFDPKIHIQEALRAAGLDTGDPYQKLRRTYIRLCIEKNISIGKIAQRTGHSIKILQKHYLAIKPYDSEIADL
ncbi:MAG: tyrosine-type recombinase/integrase [Candidatus Hydrogenedentes bacterium]|nr:tyrosine-type recombinase/integrase [Candidatus Hydrogenedentota bacterium]